jgi:dihydropteroate synthase
VSNHAGNETHDTQDIHDTHDIPTMHATDAMRRPILMGILNLTPDSFSGDGVLGADPLRRADEHAAAGADIIDLGAESTRPGAQPLDAATEWARLEPVLRVLSSRPWRGTVRLSIDTRHPETARQALALGADLINDVGGLMDPAMARVVAAHGCDLVVMHHLGLPADPLRVLPAQADPLEAVLRWRESVEAQARRSGIDPSRLWFDPGLGFGKNALQSLALVHAAPRLVAEGGRWLIGHSRKSFMRLFSEAPAAQRDDMTLLCSARLAHDGVQALRVHDVARHVAMFDRLIGAGAGVGAGAGGRPG